MIISHAEAFQAALDAYNEARADEEIRPPALNLLQLIASAMAWCRYQYPEIDFDMVVALAKIGSM